MRRRALSRQDVERAYAVARATNQQLDLVGTDLTGHDWAAFDFTTAHYDGSFNSKLLDVDFRMVNLTGADFRCVDLAGANLRGSNLTRSNLASSNLYNALLEGSALVKADLRGANLYSAELSAVQLDDTDFTDARFGSTALISVDLSGGLGLDQCFHVAPSAVDIRTFRMTAAGLQMAGDTRRSEVLRFLANAGFDDEYLAVFRSAIGKPIEYYSLFISHSSLDRAFARKLYADLRAIGVECWFDEHQILPGAGILDEIDKGVRLRDKTVLICSRNSLSEKTGWWVEQELERALRKEREHRAATGSRVFAVIPISIDDYVFQGWSSPFRATLLERAIGDFRQWCDPEQYARALERLVAAVGKAASG